MKTWSSLAGVGAEGRCPSGLGLLVTEKLGKQMGHGPRLTDGSRR